MFWIILSVILICLLALERHFFSFWSRKGFPQLNPKFFTGDIGEVLSKKISLSALFNRNYQNCKHLKVLGLYFSYRPVLLVSDPDLVKRILIKDFAIFCDRSTYSNKKKNPLSGHLFNLRSKKWKVVRSQLTTAFTPMNLKKMFPIVKNCAQSLKDFIANEVETGSNVIEMRDLFSRYLTTVLSSTVFGLENDSIKDRDNIFFKMNLQLFKPGRMATLRSFCHFLAPQLISKFQVKMVDQKIEDYLFSIINQSIELRKSSENKRSDVMQVLIDLMNNDFGPETGFEFGLNDLAANVFLFFIAGNESSSTLMSACLYELALNRDLMIKVQAEIDEVYNKETEIPYESLKNLKFLELCIFEAARKYPGTSMLTRECVEDYKITGTEMTIPKGTQVYIPIFSMHFDEDLYDNPNEFIPKRFEDSPTGSAKSKGTVYMPFGEGPRNCIGAAFGRNIIKHGLATLLSEFEIETFDGTEASSALQHQMQDFILILEKKINFRISLRTKKQ